ncbi:MAG TPA: TRAP transporter small permease subunit [Syntrophales bacterium]|nr:TRAP transporter small permease subunit [Syntrophales bacterium]HPQ45273.1 TRAP transporter small permease subunit [Syntrophales bacterium]
MGSIMNVLTFIDRMILNVLKIITITSFVLLTILITANVVVRFFPVVSLHWFDEIIELLYAYLVFYGAAALWILRGHISVGNWIEKGIVNRRLRHLYRMFIEVMVLVFAAVFFYYSMRLTILAMDVTNVFAIPKRVLYSCMPAAGILMVIYSLRNIVVELIEIRKPDEEYG